MPDLGDNRPAFRRRRSSGGFRWTDEEAIVGSLEAFWVPIATKDRAGQEFCLLRRHRIEGMRHFVLRWSLFLRHGRIYRTMSKIWPSICDKHSST